MKTAFSNLIEKKSLIAVKNTKRNTRAIIVKLKPVNEYTVSRWELIIVSRKSKIRSSSVVINESQSCALPI